jgi:hypothetical protein
LHPRTLSWKTSSGDQIRSVSSPSTLISISFGASRALHEGRKHLEHCKTLLVRQLKGKEICSNELRRDVTELVTEENFPHHKTFAAPKKKSHGSFLPVSLQLTVLSCWPTLKSSTFPLSIAMNHSVKSAATIALKSCKNPAGNTSCSSSQYTIKK